MGRTQRFNPFYALLVVTGVAFAVTACAYGVMTFAGLRAAADEAQRSSLIRFMEARGGTLLAIELAVLAVATIGAISTDRFWQSRSRVPPRTSETSKLEEMDRS